MRQIPLANPVCGNTSDNRILLKVPHTCQARERLVLSRCHQCESAFYLKAQSQIIHYPAADISSDPNFIYLIYHYLEMTPGLDWKIYLLD
jgi:hypothetical protein